MRRDHPQEFVRRVMCCQVERMTKDMTAAAPSTLKIMVVAPPDGNIFTVGPKRFHCAEVLCCSGVDRGVRRPSWMVDGKTSAEESPVAVQGTAPSVQRSPSLLRNMVSTLKARSSVVTAIIEL